jgi:hypothetical protein
MTQEFTPMRWSDVPARSLVKKEGEEKTLLKLAQPYKLEDGTVVDGLLVAGDPNTACFLTKVDPTLAVHIIVDAKFLVG